MKTHRLKNSEFFKATFIFASLGALSLVLILALILKFNISSSKGTLKTLRGLAIILIPFLLGYFTWFNFFSNRLREALTLNKNRIHSILGSFIIVFMSSLFFAIASILTNSKISFGNIENGLFIISFYIVGGLIYSFPFCLVFGFLLGNFLYKKKQIN